MRRLAVFIGPAALSLILTVLPVALASSFTFVTFDVTFFGAVHTLPTGINDLGEVVGTSADAAGSSYHGFLRSTDGSLTLVDVPFTGAANTIPYDLDEIGVVVGEYEDAAGAHCFVLKSGLFYTVDVPFPGAFNTRCRGVNNRGQIV